MERNEKKMGEPKPVYLLAGGRQRTGTTQDTLIRRILTENLKPSPRIAYVGAANGDDTTFFNRVASLLKEAGAGEVAHAQIALSDSDLEAARRSLASADAIFVSGGDVDLGMQVLKEKNMIEALRKLYEDGKLFFGSSAGSIMLAKQWIRWRSPDDDSSAELFPCLGFAPILCDTHGEEDKWEELQAALKLSKNGEVGYGIISGRAIRVSLRGEVEALGGAINRFTQRSGRIMEIPDLTANGT